MTDANGNYSLTAQQVNNNASGSLYFQLSGYFTAITQYNINASPTTANFALLPGGRLLQGTVSDASTQAGISGAVVAFFFSASLGVSNGDVVYASTDTGGQYSVDSSQFYEPAAGGFDVDQWQSAASGYFNASGGTFHVGPSFPTTHNIQLTAIANTPSGTNVLVQTSSVSLTFPSVTQSGVTTVTTSSSGPSLPSGFQVGTPPTYYAVSTTATFSGQPTICINFASVNYDDPTQLTIWHYDTAVGSWVQLSTNVNLATTTACATTPSFSPFALLQKAYGARVQQPINPDGSSVFSIKRGVVPVKFTLNFGGVATCKLPAATISLFRTAGGVMGPIDESVYFAASDSGSNFRIDTSNCQYVYNLAVTSLGKGTYRVNISISGRVAGYGVFGLE
jgi:hypothetical protein